MRISGYVQICLFVVNDIFDPWEDNTMVTVRASQSVGIQHTEAQAAMSPQKCSSSADCMTVRLAGMTFWVAQLGSRDRSGEKSTVKYWIIRRHKCFILGSAFHRFVKSELSRWTPPYQRTSSKTECRVGVVVTEMRGEYFTKGCNCC